MHRLLLSLLFSLTLSACVIGEQFPDIPPAPLLPPPQQEVTQPPAREAAPPAEVPLLPTPEAWTFGSQVRERLPQMAAAPLPASPPAASVQSVNLPPPRPARPEQIIKEAQHAARVAPTREGYWGNSGSQRYLFVPGKIWDIYLTAGLGTKLTLPPGEVLAHALILNPKSFDVNTATVGNELTQSSIILIRPCAASEEGCVPAREVDVAVTSASGRGYNLHLIIGKVGMVEVSWELTPVPLLEVQEPGTVPRRQP